MRKIDPTLLRIVNWLRFEHCSPASQETIEQSLGVSMTPNVIAMGDYLGILRHVPELGGYV